MNIESTIRAYQGVLTKFVFSEPVNFPEDFAVKRYLKKMERPDPSKKLALTEACFRNWLVTDEGLPKVVMPSQNWYKARILIHKWVNSYLPKSAPVDFPQGSEFFTTRGKNSLEARLSSSHWSSTIENMEAFTRLCYNHKGLRRAVRRRYTRWYLRKKFDVSQKQADIILWRHYSKEHPPRKVGFAIFSWKLARVTTIVGGSRFSTVDKNNLKRRPINIEPFGNLLVQRVQGNRIRQLLKAVGIDLDSLASRHGDLIKNGVATIDLSDASDSVSMDLVRFLLPKWFMEELMHCRSPMTLGLDGDYYIPKKISSMGCGFTFELMTLILTALGKTFDRDASVFGDDIIIARDQAPAMISHMEQVGFRVNKDKTFIDTAFRESCGSNYHDDFGYIESYDFIYPTTIHDCAVVYNKAKALSLHYKSFEALEKVLLGFTPKALHGGPLVIADLKTNWLAAQSLELSGYFMTGGSSGSRSSKLRKLEREIAERYQYPSTDVEAFKGFVYVPELRTKTLRTLTLRHWAKYEMYLASGRKAKDILTGSGHWVEATFIRLGSHATRIANCLG